MEEILKVYRPGRKDMKVVCIGGGHGLSAMLRGLKNYTKDITAIVAVSDDGGGSGVLREDLKMLPPGDIRSCILALANTEPTMEQLVDYRFTEGALAGQSFGNLFLAAIFGMSHTFDEAVARMGEVLAITGRVLPVTNQDVHLEATFENGETVFGESKIALRKKLSNSRIDKVRLVPEHPVALDKSLQAIAEADLIVLAPGSLYTSIIPNLLVDGMAEAVANSKALKMMIMNIMTQDGETEQYTGLDHLEALNRHCGKNVVDVCIVNNGEIPQEMIEAYAAEGGEPITLTREEGESMGVHVYHCPLLAEGLTARHNPGALASAIVEIYERCHR